MRYLIEGETSRRTSGPSKICFRSGRGTEGKVSVDFMANLYLGVLVMCYPIML